MPRKKWASAALYSYLGTRTPEWDMARAGSLRGHTNPGTEAILNAVVNEVKLKFDKECEEMELPNLGKGGTDSERDIILKERIKQWFLNRLKGTSPGTGKRRVLPLKTHRRRALASHHAYSKLFWKTKLKPIIDGDYSNLKKNLPEGATLPGEVAFRNVRLKQLLEDETETIKEQVEEFVKQSANKEEPAEELEWVDAEELGEEEVARRNKLWDRQVKVAALRRTIDEAQISLAEQTGCVCATFWAAPVPFRGGRVSAYALANGKTSGGKELAEYLGREWSSITGAFTRWARECFTPEQQREASLAPDALASPRPDQDHDKWYEKDMAGDTATDILDETTSQHQSKDQCIAGDTTKSNGEKTSNRKDKTTTQRNRSANSKSTVFNPNIYLHTEGDPEVPGAVYLECKDGELTVRYRLPHPEHEGKSISSENDEMVNQAIRVNHLVRTAAFLRSTVGLAQPEEADVESEATQAVTRSQTEPAAVTSTTSPIAARNDTTTDTSTSQAGNGTLMPHTSALPSPMETVPHEEDGTQPNTSNLGSERSQAHDLTPPPPCVDLEVPAKHQWMQVALDHIKSLMENNRGPEISFLWASLEKGLGYPSGVGDSFELDTSSLPIVVQDWLTQFTTSSDAVPRLETDGIETSLLHITKQWWASLHPRDTAMCVDGPDSRDRWQPLLKGGCKGLIRFLVLLALCPAVSVAPDLGIGLLDLVDDVVSSLRTMVSVLADSNDATSSSNKRKAADEGVEDDDAGCQPLQNKRRLLTAPPEPNGQPKRKPGRPKKVSKENDVHLATRETENIGPTTRASAQKVPPPRRSTRGKK